MRVALICAAWLTFCLACSAERASAPPVSAHEDAGREEDVRSGAGETCARRADCSPGLICLANTCASMASDSGMPPPIPLGDRGETCTARNDCAQGLACVGGRCVPLEDDTTFDMKQCFRVQCDVNEDCCDGFVAPITCPTWKSACSGGDMSACASYNASCMCNQQCLSNTCTAFQRCSGDADCGGGVLRCLSDKCLQCAADSDCKPAGQRCVANVCRPPCQRNEQCPLFFECKSGECVSVGCHSDRECYFSTKLEGARCLDTQCVTPCHADTECADLQACEKGACRFVGCQTSEECRVFLNLASLSGPERAVCRMPDR
jgi:hypothetical protein